MDLVTIAKDFFTKLNKMNHEDLTNLIAQELGSDLTLFIQNYAKRVADATEDTNSLKKNFSTMLIIGYLLKGEIEASKLRNENITKSNQIH